ATTAEATDMTIPSSVDGAVPAARALPVHPTPVAVSVGQGIHINIEIHIAADASSETIENIFRNMRRYVLNGDGSPGSDATTTVE
ncbi:MAG: hypothetical protein J2P17_28100, partial [Mycobacterium sp.]|nr:hypothetical protein [Mycobacterium sp.]